MEDRINFEGFKEATQDEMMDELRMKLSQIIMKRFSDNPMKQGIKESADSLNFACPYCGDSSVHHNKKRGHILIRGRFNGHFKCFNCGKYVTTKKFFQDFNMDVSTPVTLGLDKIVRESEHMKEEVLKGSDPFSMNMKFAELSFTREEMTEKFGFLEVEDERTSEYVRTYLLGRKIFKFMWEHFMYDPKTLSLIILNRLEGGNVIAYQSRDLTGKRTSKYLTYNIQKMHEILNDGVIVENGLISLSMLFNMCRVDLTRPVVATEGPIDAFFLRNAIALTGASKNINISFQLYYLYDDDKTGKEKSADKISKRCYVFLWSKFKKDYNIPKKGKKMDINDVMIYFMNNGINVKDVKWHEYFSNNPIDAFFI